MHMVKTSGRYSGPPFACGFVRRRRSLLLSLGGLTAITLGACGRSKPEQAVSKPETAVDKPAKFKGIYISNADFGQDFRLADTAGRERTVADFKGKAVVVFFGFTQCPDVCPTALTRAAEIKRLLGADGDRLQVVFITIDPERDTSEVLAAYVTAFDPSFIALRGDLDQTAQTAKDFRVFYMKVPTGSSYTMDHSTLSYVYAPQGKLRLVLRHQQTAEDCAADLRQVLQSA